VSVESFIEELRSASPFVLLSELAADETVAGTALRHDVDHSWDAALDLALRLHASQIRSTFFLLPNSSYCPGSKQLERLAITLGELGHEVGLHLNLLADVAKGALQDPIAQLDELTGVLDAAGNHCRLVASHGDPACYQFGFANYWLWSDVYERVSLESEGRNAEGTLTQTRSETLRPSSLDVAQLPEGFQSLLGSADFESFNLLGEATFLPNCGYFSDSGGTWKRSVRPQRDTLEKRNQILLHPEYWKLSDSPRTLVLSIPRSGSKWLSRRLRTIPGVSVTHDEIFSATAHASPVANLTSFGFGTRVEDDRLLSERLLERRQLDDLLQERIVHLSTYGLFRLDLVRQILADYKTIYLRRDPVKIAKSLMHRGWFKEPGDHDHPHPGWISTDQWRGFSQLERIVSFIVQADAQLASFCFDVIDIDVISADTTHLQKLLFSVGLPYSPRLDDSFDEVADATAPCGRDCCRLWSALDSEHFSNLLSKTKEKFQAHRAASSSYSKFLAAMLSTDPVIETDEVHLTTRAEVTHTYKTARKSSWRQPSKEAWGTQAGDAFRLTVEAQRSSGRASIRALFYGDDGLFLSRNLLSIAPGESRSFQITVPVWSDKVDFALYEPKLIDAQASRDSSATLRIEHCRAAPPQSGMSELGAGA